MTYPEGTRVVVWVGGFAWNGQLLSGGMMQTDFWLQLFPVNVQYSDTVRESAAKCAERMLEMLQSVLPLLEQGTTAIPDDNEAFGFDDYEDAIVDIKALIAEAEGKDAK